MYDNIFDLYLKEDLIHDLILSLKNKIYQKNVFELIKNNINLYTKFIIYIINNIIFKKPSYIIKNNTNIKKISKILNNLYFNNFFNIKINMPELYPYYNYDYHEIVGYYNLFEIYNHNKIYNNEYICYKTKKVLDQIINFDKKKIFFNIIM